VSEILNARVMWRLFKWVSCLVRVRVRFGHTRWWAEIRWPWFRRVENWVTLYYIYICTNHPEPDPASIPCTGRPGSHRSLTGARGGSIQAPRLVAAPVPCIHSQTKAGSSRDSMYPQWQLQHITHHIAGLRTSRIPGCMPRSIHGVGTGH